MPLAAQKGCDGEENEDKGDCLSHEMCSLRIIFGRIHVKLVPKTDRPPLRLLPGACGVAGDAREGGTGPVRWSGPRAPTSPWSSMTLHEREQAVPRRDAHRAGSGEHRPGHRVLRGAARPFFSRGGAPPRTRGQAPLPRSSASACRSSPSLLAGRPAHSSSRRCARFSPRCRTRVPRGADLHRARGQRLDPQETADRLARAGYLRVPRSRSTGSSPCAARSSTCLSPARSRPCASSWTSTR